MHIFKAGALVAAALFSASAVHATITSTATLSGFRYELYDLNLNDGIAASISFSQGYSTSTAGAVEGTAQTSFGNMPTLVAVQGASRAESRYLSSDFIANEFVSQTATEIGSGGGGWSTVGVSFTFTLSASAGVRLYADSFVNFDSPQVGGNQFGSAETFLQIYGGPTTNYDFNPSSHYDFDSLYGVSQSSSVSRTLSAYYANNGQNWHTFSAHTLARSNAWSRTDKDYQSFINPIPEPETYALMLAGLGLMGAVARRRKAKQA